MAKTTKQKINKLSNNLLRIRTIIILQKRKLQQKEDSIQKYLAERDVEIYDKYISDIELEFNMCKYILNHIPKN